MKPVREIQLMRDVVAIAAIAALVAVSKLTGDWNIAVVGAVGVVFYVVIGSRGIGRDA
jgi:hypothetical protein